MKHLLILLCLLLGITSCSFNNDDLKDVGEPTEHFRLINRQGIGTSFSTGTFEQDGHRYIYWLSTYDHSVEIMHDPDCLLKDLQESKITSQQ